MNKRSILLKLTTLSLAAVLIITAAAPLYASGGATGPTWWGIPHEKLWDFLWRTINFAALVFILVKFLAKPLANAMKNRQAGITEQFEDVEARKAEAERTYKEFEEKLASIDQEISEIIETAKAQGEAEKQKILEEASRAADDIKRQAEMAVQHELSQAKLLLREEVANQAVVMAEELIRKNLQPEDQVKLIEDYLEKVGAIQ